MIRAPQATVPVKTPQRSHAILQWMVLAVAVLILAGCNREIVRNGMTEDQANEVMSVLISYGVESKKVPRDKAGFEVNVPKEDLGYSLQLMKQYELPRDPLASPTCRVFKKEGMISAPIEDRARWMCSKALELEKAVHYAIDGVVTATARVSYPERDPLADKGSEVPHASIAIKHRRGARIDVDKVKAIMHDSNSGVKQENVSVTLFEADYIPRHRAGAESEKSAMPSATLVGVIGGLVMVSGAAFWLRGSGLWTRFRNRGKKQLPAVVNSNPSAPGSN
jgi:type III secretion system YscJ/HrcJ family lipoprotein